MKPSFVGHDFFSSLFSNIILFPTFFFKIISIIFLWPNGAAGCGRAVREQINKRGRSSTGQGFCLLQCPAVRATRNSKQSLKFPAAPAIWSLGYIFKNSKEHRTSELCRKKTSPTDPQIMIRLLLVSCLLC